jgi:transcriptional regulator with XRE-family HTH domain
MDKPGETGHDSIPDIAREQVAKVADLGRDIGEYIRQQRSTAKISLRQLSKLAGVSNPYLSQIERGLRKPSAEILQQIARGLRISAEALYVQAGILDLPTGGVVSDAIRADAGLNERQKQILLDVYESFRRENAPTQSTVEGSDVDGTKPTDPEREE